jgi:hypothetical protein
MQTVGSEHWSGVQNVNVSTTGAANCGELTLGWGAKRECSCNRSGKLWKANVGVGCQKRTFKQQEQQTVGANQA